MSFSDVSAAVVAFLKDEIPMGSWAVTRYDGEHQVYLEVEDESYGLIAGAAFPWDTTLCRHAAAGTGPEIAPDAMSIPQYAAAAEAAGVPVGAYVGIPITRSSGELFGTLCGFDTERKGQQLSDRAPLLQLLSTLLSSILEADLARTDHARALERAQLEAETDALTGLRNRGAWDRHISIEDERGRRFGDPASVIVVDLDRLKVVNDTMGHAAGDELIRRAARTLIDTTRSDDIVARLGGDEFGVVVANATRAQVTRLVQRLERAFADVDVNASIGEAPYEIAGGFAGAWDAADRAMYARKRLRCSTAA